MSKRRQKATVMIGELTPERRRSKVPTATLKDLMSQGLNFSPAPVNSSPANRGIAGSSGDSSSGRGGLRSEVLPDGRTCLLCELADTSKDHVNQEITLVWGYPPDPTTKKNVGNVCFYCRRLYKSKFVWKYNSVHALKEKFGSDMEELRLWKHWWDMAIEIYKKAGNRDVRVSWGDEESARKLIVNVGREVRVCDPEDELIPVDDYVQKHGDWRSNGKNHQYVDLGWGGGGYPFFT